MSDRRYYHGYGEGRPAGRERGETTRQRRNIHPPSNIPRPEINLSDRTYNLPAMAPNFSSAAIRAPRGPLRDARMAQAAQQIYEIPFEQEEDFSETEPWPLTTHSPAGTTRDGLLSATRDNSSSPVAPRRPARPDELPQRLDRRQHGGDFPRHMPFMAPTGGRYPDSSDAELATGHWRTNQVFSYELSPPPDRPLPGRPPYEPEMPSVPTSHEDLTAIPRYQPPSRLPQQAAYQQEDNRRELAHQQQENRRPPLGPPPSARRGPSYYYPQVGPVLPIPEETDSMRGSTRTGSVNTAGHDSKTSFASSNAIPIGISQTHLERGREVVPPPVRRPVPFLESEDEDNEDSPVTARKQVSSSIYTQDRDQPSPDQAIVRQASLGKRSKPTLTTVKSSDQFTRSGGEARAGLSSQQQSAIRDVANADIQRAARARALTQEMLEGNSPTLEQHPSDEDELEWYDQARPGASSAQDEYGSHFDQQQPDSASATMHMHGLSTQDTNQSDASYVTNPYPGTVPQSGKDFMQKPRPSEDSYQSGASFATNLYSNMVPQSGKDFMQKPRPSEDSCQSGASYVTNPYSDTVAQTGKRSLEDEIRSNIGPLRPGDKEFFDAIAQSQLEIQTQRDELQARLSQPRAPLAPAVDSRVEESIIGSLEKGGALSAEEASELKQPMGGLSERAGKPRPPRLNIVAVKEAEDRGSLSSMTEMIRRATRLASNLERGKTASRMGMDWTEGARPDEKRHQSGSMSDMIASFPPPGLGTPPGSRNTFRGSLAALSARGNRHSALGSDSDAGAATRRRRCCGLPIWAFISLLLLLIAIVVVAVVVPVMLVAVPRQAKADSTKVGSCAAKLTCENGGTNILGSDGLCECLCVNGYTGSTCTTYQQSGCASINAGTSTNATIGESLPRLLDAASNFSIPLDTQELLGLFSSADIDCNVQNQLVTFVPSSAEVGEEATTHNNTMDFARVAVLYVFQDSHKLQTAADAQEELQAYFRYGSTLDGQSTSADNVTLGNGYVANLVSLSVVGGK